VFGTTAKAARVIPNKVYQCMGMDRAVITGDTPAVRESFHDGVDVVLTAPGDADALAAAILRLARDPALRARLGRVAGERVRREFSPVPLARRFVAICEETMSG
jgi:glycosyltransferase involved in cell wall biosynthesis